jgi:YggT family protein
MFALFSTIDLALSLFTWVIILSAVFSWLYSFNIINSSNQFVNQIGEMLYRVTEPALRPIRKYVPALGGLDISPVILLLGIYFLRLFLRTSVAPMFL